MSRVFLSIFLSVFMFAGVVHSQADLPPIEAYGDLPAISEMAISPDGEHLAFIQRSSDMNVLRVIKLANESTDVYAADIGEIKANDIGWAGNEHVILRTSATTRINGFIGKIDYSGAFSVNIKKQKIIQLLTRTDDLYPGQSGLGRIVGHLEGTNDVVMPAFIGGRTQTPVLSLMKVDLDSGKGRIFKRGDKDTVDWFVDKDGTILAKEDYDNKTNQYRLSTQKNGNWETVLSYETELGPRGLVGIMPDQSSLVMFLKNSEGFNELRRLGFDGKYADAEMTRENTEIDNVLIDRDRVVFGVAYGGLQPSYDFFDEDLARDVKNMQDKAANASVRLVSWSDNFEKLIFYIEGTAYAGDYFLLDRKTSEVGIMASARPAIPQNVIGEVLTIEYPASDGLKIPGIMTVPNGSDMKGLPAIIMPHGGPEAHDEVGFDWMAQYFASRGYLVFQPNFRGSDGFGTAFTEAGYGGWGGVMQQDITDGVAALVNGGMIDPERVCIVGWSYGGYAALAGGAFTPDLYKCVAAIAPVSDLPQLLFDEKNDHGKDHWVVSYWEGAIAKGDATKDFLRERSPAMYAENFTAPVLLIHGKDDLVVKINQSRRMEAALKRAGKQVDFLQMRGEDHGLSTPGARLEALKALDTFIEAHIGTRAG